MYFAIRVHVTIIAIDRVIIQKSQLEVSWKEDQNTRAIYLPTIVRHTVNYYLPNHTLTWYISIRTNNKRQNTFEVFTLHNENMSV